VVAEKTVKNFGGFFVALCRSEVPWFLWLEIFLLQSLPSFLFLMAAGQ